MKILIVDDSKTSLLIIKSSLETLGHTTVCLTDPNLALTTYIKERPDLVILDVVMDECNGYDCAKLITDYNEKNNDWVPIIFLSAELSDTAIEQGIEAGGDDYLTKPFNPVVLKAKINAMNRIATMRLQLLESNIKLETLSQTDTLTGLSNRNHFEHTTGKILASSKRHNESFALFFIDLDKFKNINDTLGHHAGDEVLRQASQRITDTLRKEDFVARLGGDEFAALLINIGLPVNIGNIAQKIITELNKPFLLDDCDASISASIGIACYPEAGTDIDTLSKNADIAMYRAKSMGRSNYQYFTKELNEAHEHKIKIEQVLASAIEHDEITIVLQPKYQLKPLQLIGFEVLLRFDSKKLGKISPDVFIPIAEESGLINIIGNWVIEQACKTLYNIRQQFDFNLHFAINVSPSQLSSDEFLLVLQKNIDKYNISPNEIEIELTETAIMAYSEAAETALKSLRDRGIRIYIDDFGTGFSSLNHLKRLPIDGLKIDKSFVADIPDDKDGTALVRSIITLAASLGLDIVAEGIETAEQLKFLTENDCIQGQGYHLGKPLSVEDSILLVKSQQPPK